MGYEMHVHGERGRCGPHGDQQSSNERAELVPSFRDQGHPRACAVRYRGEGNSVLRKGQGLYRRGGHHRAERLLHRPGGGRLPHHWPGAHQLVHERGQARHRGHQRVLPGWRHGDGSRLPHQAGRRDSNARPARDQAGHHPGVRGTQRTCRLIGPRGPWSSSFPAIS